MSTSVMGEAMFKEVTTCMAQMMAPVAQGVLEMIGAEHVGLVVNKLKEHFQSSDILPQAILESFDRGIRTIEVALAGPRFYEKTANKEFAEKFRTEILLPFLGNEELDEALFIKQCLQDLKILREQKLFQIHRENLVELAKELGSYAAQDTNVLSILQQQAQQAICATIRALTFSPYPLARLLERDNIIAAAASMHFGMAIQKDEYLFRAFFMVNQQGLNQQLELIARKLDAAGLGGNNEVLANLQRQEELLQSLRQQMQMGLKHVRQEIVSAFASSFQKWEGHFGNISRDLDGLYAVGQETIQELQQVRQALSEVGDKVEEVGAKQNLLLEELQNLKKQLLQFKSLHSIGRQAKLSDSLSIRPGENKVIRQFLEKFRSLQGQPEFQAELDLQIEISTLLSAAGETGEAEKLLGEVQENASGAETQALAAYNRFINFTEAGELDSAFFAYTEALDLDRKNYQLFETHKYTPEKLLGAGGFGVVFLCHSAVWDRVVVKSLSRTDAVSINMVMEEARALAQTDSSYIIGLKDFGYLDWEKQQGPFIVMDYFPGIDMDSYITKNSAFSIEKGLRIARAIAIGMRDAHKIGVIHRDLKPANILYQDMGKDFELKIIDFGLALRGDGLQELARSVKTGSGRSIVEQSIAGTIKYAPPEQMGEEIDGKNWPVDMYSDVFAFGRTMKKIFFGTLEPHQRDIDSFANRELVYLISDCDARDPSQRPQNFDEVLKLLDQASQGARPPFSKEKIIFMPKKETGRVSNQTTTKPAVLSKRVAPDKQAQYSSEMEAAHVAEKRQDYQKAKRHYLKALQWTPEDVLAKKQLDQLENKIKEQRFERLVAEAQQAESSQDWSAAILHYHHALNLKPQEETIKHNIQELKQKQKLQSIQEKIRQESWGEAIQRCEEMLQNFPGHDEAQELAFQCWQKIRQKRRRLYTFVGIGVLLILGIVFLLLQAKWDSQKYQEFLSKAQKAKNSRDWKKAEDFYKKASAYAGGKERVALAGALKYVELMLQAATVTEKRDWQALADICRKSLAYVGPKDKLEIEKTSQFAEMCHKAKIASDLGNWDQAQDFYRQAEKYAGQIKQNEFLLEAQELCRNGRKHQQITDRIKEHKTNNKWDLVANLYKELADYASTEEERRDYLQSQQDAFRRHKYQQQVSQAQEAVLGDLWQKAAEHYAQAESHAPKDQIENLQKKQLICKSIAKARDSADKGQWNAAKNCYKQALGHASAPEDRQLVTQSYRKFANEVKFKKLISLAQGMLKKQNWKEAEKYYQQAEQYAVNDQNRQIIRNALDECCVLQKYIKPLLAAIKKKDWQGARQMYGRLRHEAPSMSMEKYRWAISQIPYVQVSLNDCMLPRKIFQGASVNFAYTPREYVESIEWDFGDGARSKEWSCGHTYKRLGSVLIALTINDGIRAYTKQLRRYQIEPNQRPEILSCKIPDVIQAKKSSEFEVKAQDPEKQALVYNWDLGDGNSKTGASIWHSYDKGGSYVVKLRVSDNFHTIVQQKDINVIAAAATTSPQVSTTTRHSSSRYSQKLTEIYAQIEDLKREARVQRHDADVASQKWLQAAKLYDRAYRYSGDSAEKAKIREEQEQCNHNYYDIMAGHRDPAKRLRIAKKHDTPINFLRKLARDSDPKVREAAQRTLKRK